MKLESILQNDQGRQTVDASDLVFGREVNSALVHQVVTAYLANQRAQSYRFSDTSARSSLKKSRSDVSGGGRKPRPQKGSGRARVGSIRSPIFVGGGMTFGSSKPNYHQKVNKKMYRSAICSILSGLREHSRLFIGQVDVPDYKTKNMVNWFAQHNLAQNALIIADDFHESLFLSARNLPNVTVITPDELNPVLLLKHQVVVIHPEALKTIEEIFA
jgi:large subunit ribosomal protein L4